MKHNTSLSINCKRSGLVSSTTPLQDYSQTCSNSVHWNHSGNAKLAEAHKQREKVPGTNKVIEINQSGKGRRSF